MKTIIYQQADNHLKQPAVTLQFPDACPNDETQNRKYEKIREEICGILQQAVIDYVMSTEFPLENTPQKQGGMEENT